MVEFTEDVRDAEETAGRIPRHTRHRIIIETDDPKYQPASKVQVDEMKGLLENIKSNIECAMPDMQPKLLGPMRTPREDKPVDDQLRAKFDRLVSQWKGDTRFASTVLEMATHPAYQQIIGMGSAVVPLILHRLTAKPDHWFWALKAITGEDPVAKKSRGNLNEMTEAWLNWARAKGYGC